MRRSNWLFLVLALCGCRTPPPRFIGEPPFGLPQIAAVAGRTHLIVRPGYTVAHSDEHRVPLWVLEHLRAEELTPVPKYRRPKWEADPELPPEVRAELGDYQPLLGEELDHGHMAPSADFGTKALRDQTFFLSNSVPQAKHLNRALWRNLETRVRKWVKERGEAWVITGAVLAHDSARVSVPTHVFKIVLARDGRGGYDAIAFIVENRDVDPLPALAAVVHSVDEVEALSGVDFFPELAKTPDAERALEATTPVLW